MQFIRSQNYMHTNVHACVCIYTDTKFYQSNFTRVSCEKHRLHFFAIAQQRTPCARIWLRTNTRAVDLENVHPASIITFPNSTAWFRIYHKPRRNWRTKAEITDDTFIYSKYPNSQLFVPIITVGANVWYRSAGTNPFWGWAMAEWLTHWIQQW